jgi:hypothetical protein
MQFLISLFNTFSGPIGGLIEKGILAGFMYAAGKGWIPADTVGTLATAAYTLFSGLFTAVTKSTTGKIVSINKDDSNGVKVVPAAAPSPAVNAPQ